MAACRPDPTRRISLAAVVAYHLIGEGVVARTAQNLAAVQYKRLAFPGLGQGNTSLHVTRRGIGIGVTYARRRIEQDPERSRAVISAVIDRFGELAGRLLRANDGMESLVTVGYGVEPKALR